MVDTFNEVYNGRQSSCVPEYNQISSNRAYVEN